MSKIHKIVSSLAVLISIILIIIFSTIPAGRLWDKYVVLYVPTEAPDDIVLSSISQSGIKNSVFLSGQYLPLNINPNSIEYAMYKINIDSEKNDYIKNRNSYFFDKSNTYRLYYIPTEYEGKINKCMSILKDYGINSGIDRNGSYPIIYPIAILLIAIAVCFFSKNKVLYIISSFIPILYVFCNPFFTVSIAISLLLLCNFFICNIWKRAGALKYLHNFIFIPICIITSILCCFASSLLSGFLFIVALVGIAGILITYYWLEDLLRNRKSFVPVFIRPAKMVSIFSEKTKTVFNIISISLFFLLLLFIFTSTGVVNQLSEKLMLPSKTSIPSDSLSQFDDYYKWTWDVMTYPYKSLNNENHNSLESVQFPTYESQDLFFITENQNILNFDEKFKEQVFENINELQFNSIEQVMSTEGNDFIGGYNSTSSYHIDLFGIIMIIVCYSILLFIYFSIIIRLRKSKKVQKNDNK